MALDLSFLKKKAGPLTYWEWIVVGSASLAAVIWIRKRYSGSNSSQVANAYDPLGQSDVSPAGSVITGTSSGGTAGGSQYQSNSEWGNAAVDALIKAGVAPGKATQAIADYLAGANLSDAEQALVGQAIGLIGNPPGGPLQFNPGGTGTGGSSTTGGTGTNTGDTGNSNTGSGGYGGGYVDNSAAGGGGNLGTGSDTNGSVAGDIPGTPAPAPVVSGTYVVKKGDNWVTVAAMYGVSENSLLAVNPNRGNKGAMYVGEVVNLPAGAHLVKSSGSTATKATPKIVGTYKVVKGDNWITVASRAGISESALLAANPNRGNKGAMYVGEVINIPSPGHVPSAPKTTTKNVSTPAKGQTSGGWTVTNHYKSYTIRKGDNWINIASRYGISERALINMNGGQGYALAVGHTIKVPG